MQQKICILGCGTYGSYLLHRLLEETSTAKFPPEIHVIEVGNDKTQSSEEIGIGADSPSSHAPHFGRYFGLGGTSARWGGQVLFFDGRDNPKNDPVWQTIVAWNTKHQATVIRKILGPKVDAEKLLDNFADIKTGIWLKYAKRNLFRLIPNSARQKVQFHLNQRVVSFQYSDDRLVSVTMRNKQGETETIKADVFYLTAGAFESCRLLQQLQKDSQLKISSGLGRNYGDHVSAELIRVEGYAPRLGGVDFLPRFFRGSMLTKRFVVTTSDQRVGFVHFLFNKDVEVFSDMKKMLFGRQKFRFRPIAFLGGLVFLTRFFGNLLFFRRLYAHKNIWSMQLDMEQPIPNRNSVSLAEGRDTYGEALVRVDWQVLPEDREAICEIQQQMEAKLKQENIPYKIVYDPNDTQAKVEDVYHPAGMLRMGDDADSVVDMDFRIRGVSNLYHFSTAMFPSARSINPTAAAFCLIEEHLEQVGK